MSVCRNVAVLFVQLLIGLVKVIFVDAIRADI